MSDWNQGVINEFRANGGKVGGYCEGANMLLLHTTGAKSGQPRINPLVYVTDSDRIVIIASKGGADTNPDWYYNLLANPIVTVEVGAERAIVLPGDDADAPADEGFRGHRNLPWARQHISQFNKELWTREAVDIADNRGVDEDTC